MDIKELEAEVAKDEEGIAIPIRRRNGKPYLASDGKPCTITVLGSESKVYRSTRDKLGKKLARSDGDGLTQEQFDRELAASAIVAWHGWESNGKPLPLVKENVVGLLQVEHILIQVQGGIVRAADFFAADSSS